MPEITSRRHTLVAQFRDAARGDSRFALLDGWHLLHEGEAAGLTFEVVAMSSSLTHGVDRALLARLSPHTDIVTVSAAVMDALSPVRSPSGVAALAHRRAQAFAQVMSRAPACIIVGCDIQDPGNVGALVRAAEAGGATGVVLTGASADAWGWKALRASMGSVFRLPIASAHDDSDLVDRLRAAGLRLIAAMPRHGASLYDSDLRQPFALLIGAEGGGVPASLLALSDAQVSIPMQPPVESLNVAIAAALVVYEARRQRTTRG